ncbi:MAG: hypothetical protein ACRCYC_12900 [Paraclostridium sp.]|uniref:hypothetical protein n=1 Tax=Paraclostridium sp. TaxID=2023273 RepID=UPI003F3AF959
MLRNQELLFGIISAVFILLYTSMYILQDIYLMINSKNIKLAINKLLPTISKINTPSLIVALVFTIPHIYYSNKRLVAFNSGYLLLFLLMLATCTNLNFLKNFKFKQYSSIISYLLAISLAVHVFFR